MTISDTTPMEGCFLSDGGSSYGGSHNGVDQSSREAIKRHDKLYRTAEVRASSWRAPSLFIIFFKDSLNVSSIYQVERTLYNVHRYFLARESPVF